MKETTNETKETPRMITVADLRAANACYYQVRLFEATFPKGVRVTLRNLNRAVKAGLNVTWAVKLLTPEQRAEYWKATAPARAEYKKAKAPALAEYEKARASAYGKAKAKAKATAWYEYWKADASAWAEYKKAKATAWAEYEKAKASALVRALNG